LGVASQTLAAIFFGQQNKLNNMATDVKQAVASAQQYLNDFYPGIKGILLEEIEFYDPSQQWLITLSFMDQEALPALGLTNRKYKLFKIDAQSGKVQAMKIRQIQE
jgi:hypothetical protein